MERQLCSSLTHAGTKYPAGQSTVINFERLVQADMISPEDLKFFSFAGSAEDAWSKLLQLGLNTGPRLPGLPSHG